jgi:hypothetical protein
MPSVTALAKSSASGPLAPIRPPQRVQISRPVSLIDDRWRKAVPDQQEIRRQPAYSPVPVAEGVDSLEASVEVGNEQHRMLAVGRSSTGGAQPVGDERRHLRKGRRRHPAGERTDVVLTERAGTFVRVQALRRRVQPGRLDHELVDLAQLRQVDSLPDGPAGRLLDRLCVHPLRRLRVALDFEVLSELLVADRLSFAEEPLDLSKDERVALDRRRVMCLLVPDALPDRVRLDRKRQPPDGAEVIYRPVKSAQNLLAARAATPPRRHSTYFRAGT